MPTNLYFKFVRTLLSAVLALALAGFATAGGKKIPLTTNSAQAKEAFLKGRDLQERLQAPEALPFFEKAIAQDPNFALAYLNCANSQATAKGFFEQLHKAVSLVDQASDGERLWILGAQAGANGEPAKQKEYFQKLVALYPDDERAHNLLGGYFFGQQEFEQAIGEYKKVTALAPNFSQAYNQMGYAYRSLENYADAEKAFQKYIALIPNDPNPYDSYAELLLKMGRFDESIKQYRKALTHNPHFAASYLGIATDLCLQGKPQAAREELQKLYDTARNDGERRAALFAKTVSYIEEGNAEMALAEMDKQYAIAEKINDAAAMAGDLGTMGTILLESGKGPAAWAKFDKSLQTTTASGLSAVIKENAQRASLYNAGRVALLQNDVATARSKAEAYQTQAEAAHNTFQIWLSHELAGLVALAEKDYDEAIAHFEQANQQNPYTLYRLALAYEGKKDLKSAKEYYAKAARFNALTSLNYAFMRKKAEQKLATLMGS